MKCQGVRSTYPLLKSLGNGAMDWNLAAGMSEQEVLADFPDPTSEDIRACLAFAAERERRLLSFPAV